MSLASSPVRGFSSIDNSAAVTCVGLPMPRSSKLLIAASHALALGGRQDCLTPPSETASRALCAWVWLFFRCSQRTRCHGEALPVLLADSLRTREVFGFILDRLKD